VVAKLNEVIATALADPSLKARLATLGATTMAGSAGEFGKLIADETEKWAKVIHVANVKVW
jgi:tripartite-type tricarboxylate transporter receptor subunit TctC